MATVGLAFALMLVFEGALPLAAPGRWRSMSARLAGLADGQLRFLGLAMVGSGAAVALAVALLAD